MLEEPFFIESTDDVHEDLPHAAVRGQLLEQLPLPAIEARDAYNHMLKARGVIAEALELFQQG